MNSNATVEIKNLTKKYNHFKALDNVNLTLKPNKIYGLLGRNGAGKTTLLNILTSRIFQTSGEAHVFGYPSYENIDILKQICFIEEKGFYATAIRIKDVLTLCRGLYPNWDQAYAEKLLTLFELDQRKKYKQLSRGMESSLGLIIGLASRTPLTIFDEPSLGLDAVIRERFYDAVIEDFIENPRTIIISTHLIDEVSRLFEDIVIIDGGKLLIQTNAAELKERAFYLSGNEADVREASKNMIVMGEEVFGKTVILSVYSQHGRPKSDTVEIQPMPLQKLFVQLIDPQIHAILEKGGVIK